MRNPSAVGQSVYLSDPPRAFLGGRPLIRKAADVSAASFDNSHVACMSKRVGAAGRLAISQRAVRLSLQSVCGGCQATAARTTVAVHLSVGQSVVAGAAGRQAR
jgi:hypothetical protein